MNKRFRKKMLTGFIVSIFVIAILFAININKITEESTTEELISFLRQEIGNINKHSQVNKAIIILNNREIINKMQVYYDIITLNKNSDNKIDYKNINKLVEVTLDKNNYSYNGEEYTDMINKYSDTYFLTKDSLLKDTIIKCFNEAGETFYPNNKYTFIEKMFGMDIDFNDEEEYMANKFLDDIILLDDNSIDKMLMKSLFTKFYNNSDPNEQIDYHKFYSVVKKHYDNKFGNNNSIGNIIQIYNQRLDYFDRLKRIANDINRLKSNEGYKLAVTRHIIPAYKSQINLT